MPLPFLRGNRVVIDVLGREHLIDPCFCFAARGRCFSVTRVKTSGEAVVRRAHDALNTGDVAALTEICDPGFRLDMSDRMLNPAVYEGHDGIQAFYTEVLEVWESFTWEPTEILEVGDTVVVKLRSTGLARGSGLEIDRRCAMAWKVEDGRALSLKFYRDEEEALTAARAGRA